MGRYVFEGICREHLQRFGRSYGLPLLVDVGRWWSRRSEIEVDLVARLSDGRYLFGECKWARSPIDVEVLVDLRRKVATTPFGRWHHEPLYALFSAAGFKPRLQQMAQEEGVLLVGPGELFSGLANVT
jgi:hypothetical protein